MQLGLGDGHPRCRTMGVRPDDEFVERTGRLMTSAVDAQVPAAGAADRRLPVLLAMAMFVLVVDTSIMNVSISAVIGDLFGRKRAYIIGLLAYMAGALAMALSQTVLPIFIFWAVIGGLGASLLLPAMQSLIHGNFAGAAQKATYALVGAAAAIAAAVGPLP